MEGPARVPVEDDMDQLAGRHRRLEASRKRMNFLVRSPLHAASRARPSTRSTANRVGQPWRYSHRFVVPALQLHQQADCVRSKAWIWLLLFVDRQHDGRRARAGPGRGPTMSASLVMNSGRRCCALKVRRRFRLQLVGGPDSAAQIAERAGPAHLGRPCGRSSGTPRRAARRRSAPHPLHGSRRALRGFCRSFWSCRAAGP